MAGATISAMETDPKRGEGGTREARARLLPMTHFLLRCLALAPLALTACGTTWPGLGESPLSGLHNPYMPATGSVADVTTGGLNQANTTPPPSLYAAPPGFNAPQPPSAFSFGD